MSILAFQVPGNPVPWERVRSKNGQHFTAPATRAHQNTIKAHASKLRRPKPLEGPLRIELRFYRDSARRCDWDNLAKTVCDALNGFAWLDDSQVVQAHIVKLVDREYPRTEVEVYPYIEEESCSESAA